MTNPVPRILLCTFLTALLVTGMYYGSWTPRPEPQPIDDVERQPIDYDMDRHQLALGFCDAVSGFDTALSTIGFTPEQIEAVREFVLSTNTFDFKQQEIIEANKALKLLIEDGAQGDQL